MIGRAVAAAVLAATPAAAQQVMPCDWQASAHNIAEPWQDNTRVFANGAVRLAVLDTIEPAAGAFWLLILSPPYDTLGGRSCQMVGQGQGIGFAGLSLTGMEATYDPASGLIFGLPVQVYDQATAGFYDDWMTVIVDQASGRVVAGFQ
jgi:hypothetical protein